MKNYFFAFILGLFLFTSCEGLELPEPTAGLTEAEMVAGLKEALKVGTDTSVKLTSRVDGYFKDKAIKILLPEEAKKVESTLRSLGMGSLVNELILKLNRAAEDAAIEAKPIFVDAITGMTITDGKAILFGDSTAATKYLNTKTYTQLEDLFQPKIKASLQKVGATSIWNEVFTTYNDLPTTFTKVNPNLDEYATEKALDGLFYKVSQEELDIRSDVTARVSETLRKVFGELDK
ncbi:MAG: DUF4197 domain-containing protein [Bacteroidia bacterium]